MLYKEAHVSCDSYKNEFVLKGITRTEVSGYKLKTNQD